MENIEITLLSVKELKEINGGSELSDWVWSYIGSMVGASRYSANERYMMLALGH